MTTPRRAAARLDESSRVLHLYTEALAGRPIPLRPAAEAPAILEHSRLDVPTSDGSSIYLPETLEGPAAHSRDRDFYKVAILFQLAYYEAGTLSFQLERFTSRSQEPGPQSDLGRLFASFDRPALARQVFALLEGLRVDAHLQRRYKGIRPALARLKRAALAARPSFDGLDPADPAAVPLEWLVRLVLRGLDPPPQAPKAGSRLGRKDARRLAAACRRLLARSATVYDSARALVALYEIFTHRRHRKPWASSGEASAPPRPSHDTVISFRGDPRLDLIQQRIAMLAAAEAAAADELSTSPTPQGAAIEELRRMLDSDPVGLLGLLSLLDAEIDAAALADPESASGGDRPLGGTPSSEDELIARSKGPASGGEPAELDGASAAAGPEDGSSDPATSIRDLASRLASYRQGAGVFYYDEWDYLLGGYRRGWCRLHERSLGDGDRSLIDQALTTHRALLARIKRQFELMRPATYRKIHRLRDGDEPDLDRVVEIVVDRRAGLGPPDDLYCSRRRQERDVAAAFLLDMSASTDSRIDDPPTPREETVADDDRPVVRYDFVDVLSTVEPVAVQHTGPPRRVIDIAKEALVLMAEALEILGDRYAIYGFSGYGRESVDFYVAKEFEAPYDDRAQGRIADMEPKQSTRMGTAIRHAAHKLARQQARQRVLLVISDGYPQDCDYGRDRSSPEHGIRDTTMALREASRRGIHTFCLTIDPAGHDYLRQMCPEESYLVIDEVAALPSELPKVYRGLTG